MNMKVFQKCLSNSTGWALGSAIVCSMFASPLWAMNTEEEVSTSVQPLKENKSSPEVEEGKKAFQNGKYKEALDLFMRGAKDDPQALWYIGQIYEKGYEVEKSYEEAMKWYLKAVEQKNSDAQYSIGRFYFWGYGVDIDQGQAMKWYLLAAEQNNSSAQCFIGLMYAGGWSVEQSYSEAMKWYLLAAEQNNSDAQFSIADAYKQGWGVEKNDKEAFKWALLAGEQNNPCAQFMLAKMYEKEEDYNESLKWYLRYLKINESGTQSVERVFKLIKERDTLFFEN